MDPESNMQEQERIIASSNPDYARLRELVHALDDWFASGGFIPKGRSPATCRRQREDAMRVLGRKRRADRFHFGFCNACERYACGESADQIRATPTKDAVVTSADDAYAVMGGVHAALAAVVDGEIDAAMHTALEFGVSESLREGLKQLALDA